MLRLQKSISFCSPDFGTHFDEPIWLAKNPQNVIIPFVCFYDALLIQKSKAFVFLDINLKPRISKTSLGVIKKKCVQLFWSYRDKVLENKGC